MTAGERFKKWIEGLADAWKLRLRGWMASWVLKGIEDTFEDLETEPRQELTTIIDELIASPDTPPTIKPLLEKIRAHQSPAWFITVLIALGVLIGTTVLSQFTPTVGGLRYTAQRLAKLYRLDPMSVISAWRRDPEEYEKLFEDLRDQGWNDERIEALKFITLFYPPPADLIRWQAREVFEPKMIERYGLDSEYEEIEKEPFYKAGMTDEQILNYWRAHWEHASYMQIVEMLHRGVLSLDKEMPTPPTTKEGWDKRDAEGIKAAFDWYRLVEIPPFWRDRLTAMMWNVPTRVDVRRFWDMRTITEERLRSIYHSQGYHGEDLEDYIKWTKVYTDFPMMMARFSKGWITEQDVRDWLKGLEIPEDRIQQFIEEKTTPEKADRTTKEKDLTKSEIIKGVKKELLTWSEGIELLKDLGYDEDEADYILSINIAVETGSPETLPEFKDLTQRWRKAVGKEAKEVPTELKEAAAELIRLHKEVEDITLAVKEEEAKLIPEEILPEEATAHLKELRVSLHRAEATLAQAQMRYDQQLAIYRHSPRA